MRCEPTWEQEAADGFLRIRCANRRRACCANQFTPRVSGRKEWQNTARLAVSTPGSAKADFARRTRSGSKANVISTSTTCLRCSPKDSIRAIGNEVCRPRSSPATRRERREGLRLRGRNSPVLGGGGICGQTLRHIGAEAPEVLATPDGRTESANGCIPSARHAAASRLRSTLNRGLAANSDP